MKLLYGLRYDLYEYPEGDRHRAVRVFPRFNVDRNNIGPRLGVAWTLNDRTVLRASTGIMYDQPLLAVYENALQRTASERHDRASARPRAGAPAFPSVPLGPSGIALPTQSIAAVDPEFATAANAADQRPVRARPRNELLGLGRLRVREGHNLPVVTNINLINPIGTLADGRPIYSTAVSAATRIDPRFNQINMVQSIGERTYKGLTLKLTRRFSQGYQFDLTYTLAKGEDNAPLTSALSVQGDDGRSDLTDLDCDRGPNILDQRHTFSAASSRSPSTAARRRARAILNHNQFGVI